MAQKDLSEKLLEDYNDVFADIVNVLLFDGCEIVKPEELEEAGQLSQYKSSENKLHEQERDVLKFWRRDKVAISLYGIENQTLVDPYMPLRIMNYDGAAYRSQLLKDKSQKKFPVITLVLYFGNKRWNKPKNLLGVLEIPKYLRQYVSDYKINVFEICYLSEKQLKMFKSDFGIVADFFVNKRKNQDYVPQDHRKFKHVDAMLKFFAAMTTDTRYDFKFLYERKGEITMDEYLDRLIEKGVKKERRETAEALVKAGIDDALIIRATKISQKELNIIKEEVCSLV